MIWYQYHDPFNTEAYADLMRNEGFKVLRINGTNLFLRRTPLSWDTTLL